MAAARSNMSGVGLLQGCCWRANRCAGLAHCSALHVLRLPRCPALVQ